MTSGKLKTYQILTVSNLRVCKNTSLETKFLSLYATEYFTISRLLFLTCTLLKHNISVYTRNNKSYLAFHINMKN